MFFLIRIIQLLLLRHPLLTQECKSMGTLLYIQDRCGLRPRWQTPSYQTNSRCISGELRTRLQQCTASVSMFRGTSGRSYICSIRHRKTYFVMYSYGFVKCFSIFVKKHNYSNASSSLSKPEITVNGNIETHPQHARSRLSFAKPSSRNQHSMHTRWAENPLLERHRLGINASRAKHHNIHLQQTTLCLCVSTFFS